MSKLSERDIVELVDACAKRTCTTEQHHNCPFGNEGMVDCVERLNDEYDRVIRKLLALADAVRGDCRYCEHNNDVFGKCAICKHFAAKEFVEGDFWELKEAAEHDNQE